MTPPKPSLKERIEAIAAAGEARPPLAPLFMAAELRAIAAELGEIAEEMRLSQGTGGFSGLTERFTLEVANLLAREK